MEDKLEKIITYNKLVRDCIPEIIVASGKKCTSVVLSNEEYLKMLQVLETFLKKFYMLQIVYSIFVSFPSFNNYTKDFYFVQFIIYSKFD